MSDSGSSSMCESTGSTSARMLERRVSNNRSELSGDGQMNYFFTWFNTWSELQKTDFVPVLAEKMNGVKSVNGIANGLSDMDLNGLNGDGGRPMSLFHCQVKLFRDWCHGWSDDQKNYLVLRLRDIDGEFHTRYEEYVTDPAAKKGARDYFEPGIPDHLVKHSSRDGENSTPPRAPSKIIEDDDDDDLKKPVAADESELSTIVEDS